MLHSLYPLPMAEINTKNQYAEMYRVHKGKARHTDSDTKRAGNIKFNYKKSDERINILPHELESGNHSQKLSEHMMGQDHQRQILIQHLMYHLTYPATERGKYTMLEQESMEAICLLQYSDEECHFTILLSTVPIEMKSSFFPPPQKQV